LGLCCVPSRETAIIRAFVTIVPILAATLWASAGSALAAPRCVINETDMRYLFTLEDETGVRPIAWLNPSERLCLQADTGTKMIGSVYEAETSLEGCSWIFVDEMHLRLFAYASFDRCAWSAQPD